MGQSELFKPFEELLLLLAKSAVYTQKYSFNPPSHKFFLEENVCKRMLSIRIHTFFGELKLKNLFLLLHLGPMRMHHQKGF